MLHAKDIAVDSLKFGTMFVVSQWLAGGSLMDGNWQKNSLFTILGFAAYQLSTRTALSTKGLTGATKMVADDLIKVGTMMIVSRLLSGGSLTDPNWFSASMATLIGFFTYDIVTSKYIKGKDLTYNTKLQAVVDDWAKVGTMLIVSRLISCESVADPKWLMSSIGVLLGFSVYNLGTSHIIDKIFG